MILQHEPFAQCIDEGQRLLQAHYKEIAWRQDKIPLAIDREAYLRMDMEGKLMIFTARDSGRLVGYAAWFVNKHPHYKTTQYAVNDVIYVDPESRGGLGIRLIKFSEKSLRETGVSVVVLHIKKILDWSLMAERLGYELTDLVHQKWIGA